VHTLNQMLDHDVPMATVKGKSSPTHHLSGRLMLLDRLVVIETKLKDYSYLTNLMNTKFYEGNRNKFKKRN